MKVKIEHVLWFIAIILLGTAATVIIFDIDPFEASPREAAIELAKTLMFKEEDLGDYSDFKWTDVDVDNMNERYNRKQWDLSKYPKEQCSYYGTTSPWSTLGYPSNFTVNGTWYQISLEWKGFWKFKYWHGDGFVDLMLLSKSDVKRIMNAKYDWFDGTLKEFIEYEDDFRYIDGRYWWIMRVIS